MDGQQCASELRSGGLRHEHAAAQPRAGQSPQRDRRADLLLQERRQGDGRHGGLSVREARLDGGISLEVFDDKKGDVSNASLFVFAACPSASAADHDVLGLHAVGYEHPGECVALLAASSLAGLVAESPEVVEADDAAKLTK